MGPHLLNATILLAASLVVLGLGYLIGCRKRLFERLRVAATQNPALLLFSLLIRQHRTRGRDSFGHFDLIPGPEGELHPAALARHDDVYHRYRDNYAEQIALHERDFASQPA